MTGHRPLLTLRLSFLAAFLAAPLVCLASAVHSPGAEPVSSPQPVVTTNYLFVTNVILVTNYVTLSNAPATVGAPGSTIQRTNTLSPGLPDLSWVPPADSFDWVQLKSGEWLKGKIKALQERQLEFDSEELDVQTFDWEDIRQMRSSRILDVLFLDGKSISGHVTVTPDQVKVDGVAPQTYPRYQLLGLTPGGSRELNYWSGKASIGLTLREGNTRSADYTAQVRLQRRTPRSRLSLDYVGNFSRVDDVESANNHRVNSEFDLWLSQRFYLVLPSVEYYRDPFQNLEDRVTAGGGVGYDLVDRPKLDWNITTGPAYQQTWFSSSQPGEPGSKGSAVLTFGSRFDWDITQRIELILEYRGIFTSREAGETTHHAVGTLSLELTKRLDLDVSFIWDRISDPKVGADGVQPKPDDYRLVVGVGLDF